MKIENGMRFKLEDGKQYQLFCPAKDFKTGEKLAVLQVLSGEYEVYVMPYSKLCSMLEESGYSLRDQSEKNMDKNRDKNMDIDGSSGEAPDGFDAETQDEDAEDANGFIMKFLEAESAKDKLELLRRNRNTLDERTISNMEASLDLVPASDDTDTRISYICDVLRTRSQYESRRLRS